MTDRRTSYCLIATLSLLAACAARAPRGGAATAPTRADTAPTRADPAPSRAPAAATPAAADPDVDLGPVEPWYRSRATTMHELNPSSSADDLSFTVNLIEFIVGGSDDVWERMAARVEAAYQNKALRIQVAVSNPDKKTASKYHAVGSPMTRQPRPERDADAERRVFKKALLLDLANADLYNHIAIASSLEKDHATAERYAKLAIAIDPTFLAAYQELAYTFKNAERYDEAIAIADRGLDVDGDIHTKSLLLARKGQAYWMLANEEEAIKAFRKSKKLGGPAWINSYLDGQQEIGKPWQDPPAE